MAATMRLSLDRVAAELFGRPLLLLPDKLAQVATVIGERAGIEVLDTAALGGADASRFVGSTRRDGRGLAYARTDDGVAVISIVGSLVNRGAWIGAASGVVSYEGVQAQLSAALADPAVTAILLDLETPGGQAIGAFETGNAVRLAARQKPVHAVVNGMAASAGYAIASGANRIVTTPTGISGSIGVVVLHADHSRRLDTAGIKTTYIQAGARKTDGNPFEPLSDEARAKLQAEVDALHRAFIAGVVRGRPALTATAIRDMEAEIFTGQAAVDVKLADGIGTFDDALAEITAQGRRSPSRASLSPSRSAALTQGSPAMSSTEHAAARAEERARITAILDSEEATGREASARHLALHTDMEPGAARELLVTMTAAPATTAMSRNVRRAGDSPIGIVIDPGGAGGKPGLDHGAIFGRLAAAENRVDTVGIYERRRKDVAAAREAKR